MFMYIVIWSTLVIAGVSGTIGATVYYVVSQNAVTLSFWAFVSGCIVLTGYSLSRLSYRFGRSADDILEYPKEVLESVLPLPQKMTGEWRADNNPNVIDLGTVRFLRSFPKDERPLF